MVEVKGKVYGFLRYMVEPNLRKPGSDQEPGR